MKKTILKLSSLLAFTVLLLGSSACAIGPVHGFLYSGTTFAGEFNAANDVGSSKTGEGCQHQILGLIAFGDAGAGSAAKAAGISRIATVDHSSMSILTVIYRNYCTIVTGE